MGILRAQRANGQLFGSAFHVGDEARDRLRQVVEEPDGGQSHGDAERGGDERLGDAGRHYAESAALVGGDLMERVHDADHGTEETDEWGRRADGGEEREATA